MPCTIRGPSPRKKGHQKLDCSPAGLLTELRTEFDAARERPQEESHAQAIREIAEVADTDETKAAKVLASIEVQPAVTRELLMRRMAEAWLAGHW